MGRQLCILCLASFLFASVAAAQPPRPVFSVEAQYEVRAHAVSLIRESFFLTSDRRAFGLLSTWPSPTGDWQASTYFGTSSPAAFATLQRRLARSRVGLLPPSCTTDPAIATTGRYELTWFGRGSRSRTILITVVSTPEPDNTCPSEVGEVLSAIRELLAVSLGANLLDVGRSIPSQP